MRVGMRFPLLGGTLLVALVLAGALLVATSGPAQAETDISGDWDVTVEGTMSGSCLVAIQQTGTDLYAGLDCDFIGSVILTGTIDPATGAFSLEGYIIGFAVALEGTATEDGGSMSGTWDVATIFAGTFSGTRTSETPSFVDLSGSWDLLLWGGVSIVCSATFDQELDDISATLDCGVMGSGSLSGSANPLAGSFSLIGLLEGQFIRFSGRFVDEEGILRGGWYVESEWDGAWDDFIGVPEGGLASGVMVVDCDAEELGVQPSCSYDLGSAFGTQVRVLLPPPGGYVGFSSHLGWPEGTFQYLPADDPLDETLWPPCDEAQRSISGADGPVSVALECAPELAESDTSTGTVVQLEMQCPESEVRADLELVSREAVPDQGTYLLDDQGSPVDPLLLGASVVCYQLGRGGGRGGGGTDGSLESPGDDPAATPTQSAPTPAPTVTPSGDVLTQAATPTPASGVLALPDTGSGPRGGGDQLLPAVLIGLAAAFLALGGFGLRLRGKA